jgi:hypothetical protein
MKTRSSADAPWARAAEFDKTAPRAISIRTARLLILKNESSSTPPSASPEGMGPILFMHF